MKWGKGKFLQRPVQWNASLTLQASGNTLCGVMRVIHLWVFILCLGLVSSPCGWAVENCLKAAPKMDCCCAAKEHAQDLTGDACALDSAHGQAAVSVGRHVGKMGLISEAHSCCKMSSSLPRSGSPNLPDRTSGGVSSIQAPDSVFHEVASLVSLERVQREAALKAFSVSDSLFMLLPAIPALAQSCILLV